MGLLESGRRTRGWVSNIVGVVITHAGGNFVETEFGAINIGAPTHAIGDHMISAGAIAADAQTSDDGAILIKWNSAAECNDSSNELVGSRARRKEIWVEWVGIVEAPK